MKTFSLGRNSWLTVGVLLLALFPFCPTLYAQDSSPIHYVNVSNATPVAPFVTWATAATNIQDAIDVAENGNTVLVTNGVYASGGRAVYGTMTNRVVVDKAVVVRSVNGPEVTVIQGYQGPGYYNGIGDGAIRCVYLTNDTVLSGFTLTNGATRVSGDIGREQSGGGVWCESTTAMVMNCTLAGNSAFYYGGGTYGGTLNNCTLTGNSVYEHGGGAASCTLNNCTLTNNSTGPSGEGGGAFSGTLNNCTLTHNNAFGAGGGAVSSTLINCTLTGNYGGNGGGAWGGTLINCTLTDNRADDGGGALSSTLNNCTLSGNSAYNDGGGASGCTLSNCIVFYNTAPTDPNYSGSTFNYCCTTPLPPGAGNITNDPAFVDSAAGNYRLRSYSPCVNAGTNQDWMVNATDLDGNPRISFGIVDMGAFELNLLLTYPPAINSQPTNQTVAAGGTATFTVVASGTPPLSYRWLFGTNPVAGGTGSSLVLSNVQPSQAGSYSVVVSNAYGPVASSNALLTVLTPPTITSQPTNQTVAVGGTTTFTVVATGSPPLNYQWFFGTSPVAGGTGSSLVLSNVQPSQAGSYSVVVSNSYGSLFSSNALLTVFGYPPTITSEPDRYRVVLPGWTNTFTVMATGSLPLNYQWSRDGTNIPGATMTSLTLTYIQLADAGNYNVKVSNSFGQTNSNLATLSVVFPNSNLVKYVNVSNATPVAPFTNWATAAISIQDAILFANAGDTVLVTNGVYATGGQTASGGLITNRVSIDRPITVQSLNGPEVTIIVGNGPLGDSAVRCVYLTNGAVLSGFTLTNGATRDSGDISTAIDTCGGGVLCESINALVTNCTLTGNSAGVTHEEWWSRYFGGNGGGAYRGTLNNCILTGNSAGGNENSGIIGDGGGVYGATLSNCTLTSNYAGGTFYEFDGGGIGGGASGCTLNNCTLTGNGAWWDGGGASGCTLNNCTLTDNGTYEYGGGAYSCTLDHCMLTGNSVIEYGGGAYGGTLNNCTLTNNSAGWGGGGACGGGMPDNCTLNNCTLTGNRAGDGPYGSFDGYGGGAYGATLNNCTLTNNSAANGGGAYGGTLNNCILTGNSAGNTFDDDGYGGGANACTLNNCTLTDNYTWMYGGGACGGTLNNCTLTGNSARTNGGGAYGGTLTNCIVFYNTAPTDPNYSGSTFSYCCTTPLPPGAGNITNEPAFVDSADGNYRLWSYSPCVNAGINQDWMTNATDLDGNPRIICGVVDMGAFELNVVCPVLITSQPTNQTVAAGGTAKFTVAASGSPPLSYQWLFGTNPVAGGTGSSLVLNNVQPSQVGSYSVVVSNAYGPVTSSNALLTVLSPPTISRQPIGQMLCPGGSWTFQVGASGDPAPSYQWRSNGANISGTTASSYLVSGATRAQAGPYDVVVSNPCGSVTSSIALLAVALPGSVVAWGDNTYGQCNVPWGLTNMASIAAGVYHSLAFKMDGTVVGWGQNDFGQTNPPVGLSNVTAMAAGWGTSFALRHDGTLEEWGWDGGYGLRATAEALTNIISVSALWDCGMALKTDHTVFVWGKSTHGETNVPAGLTDVVAVSGGGYFCMALKRDGTVVTWGSNAYGQTNTPADLSGVKAIAAGGDHCLALKSDGTVVAWGYNYYGQTDVPSDLTNAVAVSAGAYHSLALRADGTFVAWGLGSSGQTNIPPCLHGVIAISAGGYHNLALLAGTYQGQLWDVNCLPGGQVQLKVSGLPGDVFRVLASTNLLDWQVIGFVTNYCDSVQFIDTAATNYNRRYYRCVTP